MRQDRGRSQLEVTHTVSEFRAPPAAAHICPAAGRDMNRLKFSSDSEPLHPQSVTLSVQRTTLWRPEACGVGPLPPLGILWFPSVLQLEQQLVGE
ncbi:unnamed protein product [Pleuronectes platessa]|uniref:Uncharacterized protein n=1 Tax=Pleuronectes platessa TaxID=8262 RepID=A0A9N7V5G3_PLEPL|nr:unnamed protein product [Pleuronectes platessa]